MSIKPEEISALLKQQIENYQSNADIYETGTVNWEIGLASSMAIVFTVFVVILTIIQTALTKDKEDRHEKKKAKNI